MAVRSHPSPKVRGSDGERQAATAQERWPRGASPRPRSGAVAEKNYPTSEVRGPAREELPHLQGEAAVGRRRAERSYSTFKVRRAAVRRYPSSKVRSSGCALLEQL